MGCSTVVATRSVTHYVACLIHSVVALYCASGRDVALWYTCSVSLLVQCMSSYANLIAARRHAGHELPTMMHAMIVLTTVS